MKVLSSDEKSVLGMSFGTIHSCSNASVMSIIEMYLCDATASLMRSWLGSGMESMTVFAFHSHALMTVKFELHADLRYGEQRDCGRRGVVVQLLDDTLPA